VFDLSDATNPAVARPALHPQVSWTGLAAIVWVTLAVTLAVTSGEWGEPPAHLQDSIGAPATAIQSKAH
jgi:hypothetical protein